MRRPRIGIPTCLDERGRWRPGRDYSYIDRLYADSIDEAGGLPIQLPIQSAPAEAVALLDGLLLPGGDDFPSDRALPDNVTLDLVPDTQITFDRALLGAATELRLPILGICYGMQLIAQARGGVLEPHLPSANLTANEHRIPEADRHEITVEPGSALEALIGTGAKMVNKHAADRYVRAMRRPRIGIPTCLDERGRWRPGRDYSYIDRLYADSIDEAGGLPIQLPIQSAPAEAVALLDGLLLPGGDDFPSDRALPDNVTLDLVPDTQITFDRALLGAATELRLPILGICYGMQLIAQARGGVLEPHLPSANLTANEHRIPEADRHEITVEPGSALEALIGTGAKMVNSLHHQAVRAPGPDHRVAARSPDGVIEAIECVVGSSRDRAGRWEIGVQWHPEKMDEASSQNLFQGFVRACTERMADHEAPKPTQREAD